MTELKKIADDYETTKCALKTIDEGEQMASIKYLPLPSETKRKIEKLIKDELQVQYIRLRGQIRELLDQDEKEQLMLAEIEEEKEAEKEEQARQQDMGVPKNDYRRGQNSQEEDDGK